MKFITFEDIRNLNISPVTCYDWVVEMLKNKDKVILPAKISMKPYDGVFCNVMPSIISGLSEHKIGGIKIVTRYPERVPSLDSQLLIYDADTGDNLAVMDADWITAMRTGAVAAHSILLLAKENFYEIGMFGLGNTARAAMLVLANIIGDRKLHIKLKTYKDQADLFIERFKDYPNLSFTVVDSNEDVVKGSDVVISAVTVATENFCDDSCFDEGVLVVPIHTLGFTNCDLFFDKVFADDYGHVCHFRYFDKYKSFAEVSSVLNGTAKGRENDKERILAYNIGLSMHDVNFAYRIYSILEKSSSFDLDLKKPTDKFWI